MLSKPKCDKCPSDLIQRENGLYTCVECGESYKEAEVCFPLDRTKKEPLDPMQGIYILGNVLTVLSGYVGISICFVKLILEVFQYQKYEIHSTSMLTWSVPLIALATLVNAIPFFSQRVRKRTRTIIIQALKIAICLIALIVVLFYLNKN